MSHDVFISYSTKDKIIADAVCARLEESKIRVWIAPRDVPAGANFAESIINAIDTSKVFVLIWSANTNTSEHILTELNQAFDQGITIIPFRIQDVQPTSAMRYYIGRTHWLDALTLPLEKHIGSLKDTIQMNLGREPQVTEPAQVPPVLQALPREKDRVPASKKQPTKKTSPKKLTAILLAAGGVVLLGILAIILFGNLLPANLFQPASQITLTANPTQTASSDENLANTTSPTVSPIETLTQNPTSTYVSDWVKTVAAPVPDWVKDVSTPIWSYMVQEQPDFYDGFIRDTGLWDFSPTQEAQDCDDPLDAVKEISDGTMKLSIVSCQAAGLVHPGFQYGDFVLQMDVNYHNNPLGLGFDFANLSPLTDEGSIGFNIVRPGGTGLFTMSKKNNQGAAFLITAPTYIFDPSKPITITVINKNPYIIIYLDSTVVVAYDKLESYQGPWEMFFSVNHWGFAPTEYEMLELDDVRIWDLDKP